MTSENRCGVYPRKFFRLVFGSTIEDSHLAIQLRFRPTDEGGIRVTQEVYRNLKALEDRWSDVQRMNNAGYDVDFSVVPRVFHGTPNRERNLPDPPTFTCLWADIDVGKDKPFASRRDARRHLKNVGARPNIVVSSGRGLHTYYCLKSLTKKTSAARMRSYLVALAKKLKAEVGGPTHVKRFMRVPRTINWRRRKRTSYVIVPSKLRSLKTLKRLLRLEDATRSVDSAQRARDVHGGYSLPFSHLVRELKAGTDGTWAHGLCPFPHGKHFEQRPSFYVNLETGRWGCHACQRKGKASDLLGPALLSHGGPPSVTWRTLPAFDPTLVTSTKWLKKDFIPAKNITLVYGARGSFKSSYLLWVLRTIAKKRWVLYLDYENPPDVLKRLDRDLRLNLTGNSNFKIWDRFGDAVPPRPGDQTLAKLVREAFKETKRSPVLVFDSWGSLLKAGEGGETTGQVAPIYAHFRRLCDLGATIIILDHTRKYLREIIYGGEDKEAKSDVIHNFILYEDQARPTRPMVEVKSWLKRHAPRGVRSFAFRISGDKDEQGTWHVYDFEPCRDPQAEERKRQREIMRDLIRKNPNGSQDELVKLAAPRLSQNKARAILKNGVEKRHWEIEKTGHGRFVYRLSD